MKTIYQGAESTIYLTNSNTIKKIRNKKSYRIEEIDSKLIKSRTKREINLLTKAKQLDISVPNIIDSNINEGIIEMDYIDGIKLKTYLEENLDDYKNIAKLIANNISILHNNKIIHGDLTTSNMILKDNKLYFIDFGLGFTSQKFEDFAVDLHLLKEALESTHYKISNELFEFIINDYKKNTNNAKLVLNKLKEVELRGRNKHK
ncbi:Kae1-associated serine/threonine protein kinase [Candidatus Woesearchaeota archaeon]|jgi:Kae1-associated kinase Bud32|nr:Kae1-associated serine/threonine protein kinase [Candidatus Woesearchaeota archaeon]MBT4387826.1 Kae1-associated serine/threonine protein kinase [Candidatus Woesearchaeota archaeon]MBT4595645.1 Kae1-associated serine/threonine protein kinase [Candidatus Woesearchaeota archaeon]MBT5740872.1 Kae1-associated serine/threonine protein kinase [Candidatus Woesearchaeota archaeon]MBT6505153.1 Kae1-associated serine/threonine protein kinase [Candidatus Woesearchaeota archaeon]